MSHLRNSNLQLVNLSIGRKFCHKSKKKKTANNSNQSRHYYKLMGYRWMRQGVSLQAGPFTKQIKKEMYFYESQLNHQDSVIKKFNSMTPIQKQFLKIERPMTELLKGKNFSIKKQKVPYLRCSNQDEDSNEKKEIEKIMVLARQVNYQSLPNNINLDRLLQIAEEQEVN